jgi:serine/threonine protein kinase
VTEPGPATLIGRYQLVAPIGAGGMGRVWVALDTASPGLRLVALKTALASDGGAGADFWSMLSDEASLASRIDHPNVCATFELGNENGVHFLVMDWSDGASLRDLLDASAGKRLGPELAALVCSRVAAGLHAAHELTDEQGQALGVVHRDVSPQNILLSMRGHVRLADFGVAKARGQQHRPTETGEVKGKLSYMAPEQITSKFIDRRADVFALGCVLYEATLGVRPFHGSDAMATMYKILEAPLTPPRSVEPDFPEELECILLKALAKAPDARYQTAEDLGAALIEFLSATRRPFTDKHVAELLSLALGPKLRERNRSIMTTAEQLRRGETDPRRLKSPPPPAPTSTLTPEGGIERSLTFAQTPLRRPRPAWLKWAAIGGVGLALVLGGRMLRRDTTTAPSAAAPLGNAQPMTHAAKAAPTPEAPAPALVASAAVAVPSTQASVTPPPARGSRGGTPRPPSATVPTSPVATPAKVPAKKPRPIDRANPFSTP